MDIVAESHSLLQQCETLNQSQRVARLVELGARSKKDDTAKALISHLASGSLYEQLLSLETSYGSHDITLAGQFLSSSSKHLKKRAINLIALFGTDTELLDALKAVPTYLQIGTIHRLRDTRNSRKRLSVVEGFLEDLERKGDDLKLLQSLLPLGSKDILDRNLPKFLDGFATGDWSRLAKYHPETALKLLSDWLTRSGDDGDELLISRMTYVLAQWLSHQYTVDFAIELTRTSIKKMSISKFPISQLVAKRPQQAVEIILRCDEDLTESVIKDLGHHALRALPMSVFQPLFERYPGIVESWEFSLYTAEQRLLVYKKVHKGWRGDDGTLDVGVIEMLPSAERVKEARRHLKMRKFETEPSERIPFISLLPWDEAIELQTPFLRSGDADVRSDALEYQIKAVRYDDAHLSDALQLVLFRKNEQDPVKERMIDALSEIPLGRWKGSHLDALTQIIRNNLDSVDLSISTSFLILSLVSKILDTHPQWAASQIALILREQKYETAWTFKLSGVTPVRDVMAIVSKELAPILESLLKKKNIYYLATLAWAFGTGTKHWPEYLDTCENALELSDGGVHFWQLLAVLKKYRWKSWVPAISMLARKNISTAGTPIVGYVHRHQQNLLDAYLKPKDEEPRSRRDELKKLNGGFWWWTPTQQGTLAQILLKDISDRDTVSENKVSFVRQLGLLNFVDMRYLIQLVNDERSLIQEAALRALGEMDGDQGVPILIEALSDERARIAIYVLRKTLKVKSKSEAFEVLKLVPQSKVTVGKETTRLIGELGTDDAFQWLLERERTHLHEDVRIALFRALWLYLDREETWEIFGRASQNPDPKIAKSVSTIPDDGMTPRSRQRLLKLLLQLLNHTSAEVRMKALERCDTIPLRDPDNILGPRLFELIYSDLEDECDAAATAIFKTYAKTHIDRIGVVYRKLLSDRKLLKRVHNVYLSKVSPSPSQKHLRPVTHLILSIFRTDLFSVTNRVKLMFSGLPWVELRPYIFEIVPELHADALTVAEDFIENGRGWGWKEDGDELLEAELEMRRSQDERARRLALSLLIGGVGRTTGWTQEERERLEGYREDESVLVAEAAWEFSVPEKEVDDEEEWEEGNGKDGAVGDEMDLDGDDDR